MASNKRKSTLRDEQFQPKRRRDIKKNMQLIDLNEDVLVEIFLYLNEDELLDVVYASEMFLNCCRRAAEIKYRKNYIDLPLGDADFSSKSCTKNEFNRSMDFVHYLGSSISKISVSYRKFDLAKSKRFHDLVLETCHATLIDIEFYNLSIELKINKCFPKLTILAIFNGNIDNSLCQFTKWFPKVEKLFMCCVENISTKFNTRREISTLKHFTFADALTPGSLFELYKFNQFLENNPQLEILDLNVAGNWIRNADNNHRAIKTNNSIKSSMIFSRMKTVNLRIEDTDVFPHLSIPSDRIEHLEVMFCTAGTVTDFIANCSNLKTLKLNATELSDLFKGATWKKSAKHALLTHLEIYFQEYDVIEDPLNVGLLAILPYLQQCNKLIEVKVGYQFFTENYRIAFLSGNRFDEFKNRIDLQRWSLAFVSEINSFDKQEVTFTLNKL